MEFCNQALEAGHSLIVFARTPSKLPPNIKDSPRVSIIEGEFADAKARERAAKSGADVLVTFMGPVKMSNGRVSETVPDHYISMLISLHPLKTPGAFYKEFLPQVIENGIKRALILTTPSFQQPQDKGGLKWLASTTLVRAISVPLSWVEGTHPYSEMIGIGETVSAIPTDKLRWTLFRVGWLNNGPAQPVTATYTGSGQDSLGISRASIAQWVVGEIAAEEFVGKAPYICNS